MEKLLIELLKNVGTQVAVTILVVILLFKYFGSKWLERKFAERLEDHKHKLENEREKLKLKINSLFNRATKIHEKEFEVLPIAWEKLDNLLDLIRKFILETHSIPDLNNKSSQELEEFLSKQDFEEEEKQNVRDNEDKNLWFYHEKSKKVGNACLDFQNYVTKKGIFLSPEIKNKFKEAEEIIREAWAIRSTAEASKERNKHITKACVITQKKIPPIMDTIEKMVQERLGFFEA